MVEAAAYAQLHGARLLLLTRLLRGHVLRADRLGARRRQVVDARPRREHGQRRAQRDGPALELPQGAEVLERHEAAAPGVRFAAEADVRDAVERARC